jgi:hypothetical protein
MNMAQCLSERTFIPELWAGEICSVPRGTIWEAAPKWEMFHVEQKQENSKLAQPQIGSHPAKSLVSTKNYGSFPPQDLFV